MDVQTVSIVIAAVSVVIGVINSIMSNQKADQQRQTEIQTRQAELFMEIYNRWNSQDIQTAYGNLRHVFEFTDFRDLLQKYSIAKPYGSVDNFEPWLQYQYVMTYFEGLGMLVKDQLIDIEKVEDLFAGRIIWFWETYGKYVESTRELVQDPTMYDSIEYLYNQMMQRLQREKATAVGN